MPFYNYCCKFCKQKVILFHSMGEKVSKCDLCGEDGLEREINNDFVVAKREKQLGKVVESYIKEIKDDLQQQKEKKGEYK